MNWKRIKEIIDGFNIPDDVEIEEISLIEPSEKNMPTVWYTEDRKICSIET